MKCAVLAVFLGGSLTLASVAALPASAQEGSPQARTTTADPPVPVPVPVPAPATPGTIVQRGDAEQVAPVDEVDRVVSPTARGPGFSAREGVRIVRPGALLFASFDRNFDGKITQAEIEAGAAGAFAAADRNGDGAISGFEQNDWADQMGGGADILSNPMTFDVDLDRSVSKSEFAIGIKRMATQVSNGDIAFSDLMKPLNAQAQRAESASPGVPVGRPRGPNASAGN